MKLTSTLSLAALGAVLLLTGGCGGPNLSVNRSYDEYDEVVAHDDAMSPDSFVDRLGEPDEWRHEGEGDDLEMTAIWKCLDDEYREIKWRMVQRDRGEQSWTVIADVRHDCDDPAG